MCYRWSKPVLLEFAMAGLFARVRVGVGSWLNTLWLNVR